MNDIFLDEYSADEAVLKYRGATAGHGISYLLDHDYGRIYTKVLEHHVRAAVGQDGVRLLEFGCGAGMHLIHVVSLVQLMGIPLDGAFGSDFSEKLIAAAQADAGKLLKREWLERVRFIVARTESIAEDLAAGLQRSAPSLSESFHLAFGVNTFRYCHRMNEEDTAAKQLFTLLARGGVCIMMDMNAQFGFFRSRLRSQPARQNKEYYLPSLEEYARPFASAGFQILEARNFCWIPHSAGRGLTEVCRLLTPALNAVAPRHAMRSLVIAKKPA
jgi:hypothetical protein